jgi:hypothetical protein
MTQRMHLSTCDGNPLTEDAIEVCKRALSVPAGHIIPGSEHRCGFLGLFGASIRRHNRTSAAVDALIHLIKLFLRLFFLGFPNFIPECGFPASAIAHP